MKYRRVLPCSSSGVFVATFRRWAFSKLVCHPSSWLHGTLRVASIVRGREFPVIPKLFASSRNCPPLPQMPSRIRSAGSNEPSMNSPVRDRVKTEGYVSAKDNGPGDVMTDENS